MKTWRRWSSHTLQALHQHLYSRIPASPPPPQSTLHLVTLLFVFIFPFVCFQEGSDHDEGEDADAEEDEYDLAGDETSEDSDSEELDEKGEHNQQQLFTRRN